MFHESNEQLNRATADARKYSITQDALDRGEDAIFAQVKSQRRAGKPLALVSLGVGTIAFCAIIFVAGAPAKASAAELMKIASNGDMVLRHMRTFEVQPDGSLKPQIEVYADGESSRFIDPLGDQHVYKNGRASTLRKDGAMIIESQTRAGALAWKWSASAKDILTQNTKGHDFTIAVKRNVSWENQTVDRYTVEEDLVGGLGKNIHLKLVLIADPTTERTLEMDAQMSGFLPTVSKWDYPKPDPSFFELPKTNPARIYDIDIQQAMIRKALGSTGFKTVVKGVPVEFHQLWLDEFGRAVALAEADYSLPFNFGIRIDGKENENPKSNEGLPTRYAMQDPVKYDGRNVQLFGTGLAKVDVSAVGDRAKVEIPVFKDGMCLGYATFDNVPVNRARDVISLIKPENTPFWMPRPTKESRAEVHEAKPIG